MSTMDTRIYQALLRLLPRDFRARHETDLLTLYRELREDRSALQSLAEAGWDVVVQAARLRLLRRARRAKPRWSVLDVADDVWQDVVFATRTLRRRPGFGMMAAGVLALGIGASTTIFTVVDAVLLRPLPYPDADRIGVIWHDFGEDGQSMPLVNPADVRDYRTWSRTFDRFTFAQGYQRYVGFEDGPEIVQAAAVEGGFFDFFGATPTLGRGIRPEDDVPGAAPVVVLGRSLWLRRFAGDAAVVGSTIDLNGVDHRVVGVLPATFRLELPAEAGAFFPRDPEIWVAARLDPEQSGPRNLTTYMAFGRVRAGIPFSDAADELADMIGRLRVSAPEHARAGTRARLIPLRDDVVKQARGGLVFLFVAVGLVFLVACVNVSGLLLARVRGREAELSTRAALGAGRRRVIRLVLVESALLAVLGGAAGVGLSHAGVRAVRALGRELLPRAEGIVPNATALSFAVALSGLAALLAGLLPALRAATDAPGPLLSGGTLSGPRRRTTRLRDALVVAEAAVTLALLVGTGLMLRSFRALQRVEPGYDVASLTAVTTWAPSSALPTPAERLAFVKALEERVSRLPGVSAVAAVSRLPLNGLGLHMAYAYDDETAERWESLTAERVWVSSEYFAAIGARLTAGRGFTWADMTGDERVIVVDDRLAARAFPDGNPLGRSLQLSGRGARARIVGVVAHLRMQHLDRPGIDQIYEPLRASSLPIRGLGPMAGTAAFYVVVRSTSRPEEVAEVVRREARAIAPGVAFGPTRTFEGLVDAARGPSRAVLALMAFFGGTALTLAAVGLYAVLTFSVRERTREIGIRMVLGQDPAAIRRSILAHSGRLLALASALGLAGAAGFTRLARTLLYGVSPLDAATYVSVTAVLVGAGLLAAWLPARGATRVDPVRAIQAP